MTPAVSPAKFTASPAVERPKMRTTGFSSSPPLCKFERVTAKSAPLSAAVATNSAAFSLSQNLCSYSGRCGAAVLVELALMTAAAAGALGASGNGPCASAAGAARAIRDAAIKLLSTKAILEDVIGVFPAGRKVLPENRNPATMDPNLQPGEGAEK